MLKMFETIPILLALFAFANADVTIHMVNKCPHTVWPGLWGRPMPQITGFQLNAGESRPIQVPDNWKSARIWARTGCSGEEGSSFRCQTGSCGNKVACEGRTGEIPCSLAEWTFNGDGGQDFYDLSYVDGSNIPMTIRPVEGTYSGGQGDFNCKVAGLCSRDLKQVVVDELKYWADGQILGTKSACSATQDAKFCCSGAFNTPQTCPKSNFPDKFYGDLKRICPTTYLYAYDDRTSTFTCRPAGGRSSPDYTLTFCETG